MIFLPTHSASNACGGKVFTVEMHHKRQDSANPGDNIGMNIKGLDKMNMPRTGDVMVYKKDSTLSACADFDAQIQVPGQTGEAWLGMKHHSRAAARPVEGIRLGYRWCSRPVLRGALRPQWSHPPTPPPTAAATG